MRRTVGKAWWLVVLVWGLFASCETKVPAGIISSSDMVDVLYDYHLAQAMAAQASDSSAYRYRVYTQAVLQKYGLTQAEFDSSMVWYTRHADYLYDVYKQVDQRFSESGGDGGAAVRRSTYTSLSSEGDTANVWSGPTFALLTSQGSNNRFHFTLPTDTSYHTGDRIMWHFYSDWICREGERGAQAVLSLCLENDSVVVTTQSIYGNGEQRIMAPKVSLPVKRISGFVYITSAWGTSLKLLLLSDVSLVRMRQTEPVTLSTDKAQTDSVSNTESTSPEDSINSAALPSSTDSVKPSGRRSRSSHARPTRIPPAR